MARSYYSTVFEHSADEVWSTIRNFNNYPVWVDGAGESRIEDGRSGDAVGAVRDVLYEGRQIRQKLLALSDVEHSQTYGFAGAPPPPLQRYQATIRVTPVVDGDRAFVEWDATFDCEAARRDELTAFYREAFAKWLGSLRRSLDRAQ
jgi:Polyketide cyclase / dehydrase and lipid transport